VEPAIDKCTKDATECSYKLCHEADNFTKVANCGKTYCDKHKKDKQCVKPAAETPIEKCTKDASDCTKELCQEGDNSTKVLNCKHIAEESCKADISKCTAATCATASAKLTPNCKTFAAAESC